MSTSTRSPRGGYKVGPSRAPKQPCPPGQYEWRNFFGSGCKPAAEDRRRLALQFRNRGLGGGVEAGADGWAGYGSYNGWDQDYEGGYDGYNGLYGYGSGRRAGSRSGRRNYGSSSYRRSNRNYY